MSYQTPSGSRASTGYYSGTSISRSGSIKPHEARRPPSSRGYIGTVSGSPQPRSRPGSAMGFASGGGGGSSSSRPATPSFLRPAEPYTGSITVSVRPNPYSVNPGKPPVWKLDVVGNSITNTLDLSSFAFDHVFPTDKSTVNYTVYQKSCAHIVHKFLYEGFNGTVFAYGMTGSGKTHSMRGNAKDPGFVTLAIDDIFQMLESKTATSPLQQFNLDVTYLEIYNEKIIDLLAPTTAGGGASDLKIRDDSVFGNKIVGITTINITSKEQLLQIIRKGDTNRKTSATDFNSRSSRSHSILQFKLQTVDLIANSERHSILSLCDLAGSERATSSVERRKEGAYINKSLLALSTVINKLSISSAGNCTPLLVAPLEHIPYRDSKLTRLLQPALSGSSLISILCTIHLGSGNDPNYNTANNLFVSETYNTLRFAARARNIVMSVSKSKSLSFAENSDSVKLIADLKRTIQDQQQELTLLKGVPQENSACVKTAQLEAENRILNEKLEHLTRLTDLQKTETIILKNDILNDLLGAEVGNNALQVMMANLEEFHKRVNYELDEYKSYVHHLESQLKVAHEQNASSSHEPRKPRCSNDMEIDVDSVLKDQEEEIWHLKELIKDKDHIIKSLTKTSKLRRLMESNSHNTPERPLIRPLAATEPLDKENKVSPLKPYKVGLSPERQSESEIH